jgi:hypothetical protein
MWTDDRIGGKEKSETDTGLEKKNQTSDLWLDTTVIER